MSLPLARGERPHPLDPLSAAEIEAARRVLVEDGTLGERVYVAYLGVEEPDKQDVLGGGTVPRRVRGFLLDLRDGQNRGYDVVVCLSTERVISRTPVGEGQVPMLDREHELVRRVLREHGDWVKALARRGVTDPDSVYVAALSAGHYDLPGEEGRRIARVLAHLMPTQESLPWAHPIDGLVAYVDLANEEVIELLDTGPQPIPDEPGDYHLVTEHRASQKPIHITQPEGPGFDIDGNVVTWENWSVRLGYDMREGLVLHQLGFAGRPIVYRASIAEMVVPYGDPSPVRFWQNYFDTGEYLLGKLVNGLELGCDCLGEITYFDVTVTGDDGRPVTKPNAICMHEEDAGVLWKHTDPANGSRETRRRRRLVISFFVTIGNYDYGFYWYLYLDGTIELEVKATGIVFTGVYDERAEPYASQVAPGLAAPYHQHLFGARLDMTVDGPLNAVDEVEAEPRGGGYGNAFGRRVTRLRTEQAAIRDADMPRERTWHVVNPGVTNRFGDPVGYALYPEGKPALMAQDGSSIRKRAAFATRHLWVTRYDPAERYPAGDFVNQHPGSAGLPAYTANDRDIDGADLVLWHTFGLTHFPRPEDWPVMPVDTCGFVLKPVGFFDRNPTLDVPPPTQSSCHQGG